MRRFDCVPRRTLFHWFGWFFLINACVASLNLLVYLPEIALLQTVFTKSCFVLAFFAQISLFMLTGVLICVLVAGFCQWRWLNIGLAALFATIVLIIVLIDALIYQLYHMHYGALAWRIYQAGAFSEVLPLGIREWLLIIAAFFVVFLLEIACGIWMWRVFSKTEHRPVPRFVMLLVICNGLLVYGAFALAVNDLLWPAVYRYAILRAGRIVPYLSQFYLASAARDIKRELHYPKQVLQYDALQKPLNVVIIGIDAWRYGAMNATVSPNINRFAGQASRFLQHYSGGNCTQAGLFSLFYGIPPTYWDAFVGAQRSPSLLDALKQRDYSIGFFFSATPKFPEFDKTIFASIKTRNWHTKGGSSMQRDAQITREMLEFLQQQQRNRPFFAFLFYDTLHNYCETDRPALNPFQPFAESCNRFSLTRETKPLPYLNLYYNKTRYVDQQIQQVLQALKAGGWLDNTIVILTADHGEQMNDEGHGLWGHASAYNPYQLHVPMIVYWPGRKPEAISKLTTHYDVVPTLMRDALGVNNPVSDYSIGYPLFSSQQTSSFIAASYGDYAVIHFPDVLRLYPDGGYQLVDFYHKSRKATPPDEAAFKAANQQLQQFFK